MQEHAEEEAVQYIVDNIQRPPYWGFTISEEFWPKVVFFLTKFTTQSTLHQVTVVYYNFTVKLLNTDSQYMICIV